MWSLWASTLYTIQVSAPYRRVKRTMLQYTAHSVFKERFLLSQTHFPSSPKALKTFDVHVSSRASSLLIIVKPRYLNLFTWVITWPFVMRGLIHNLSFLKVNFQPKSLGRFQEKGDYFLCILVVVCHEGGVVSKKELNKQNISGVFFWLALNKFASGLLCIHTPWVESVKASGKTIEKKSTNSVCVCV